MNAADRTIAYIQTVVTVEQPGKASFDLPPVVGRSLAGRLAQVIKFDMREARIYSTDHYHSNFSELDSALAKSDEVYASLVTAMNCERPGIALICAFAKKEAA